MHSAQGSLPRPRKLGLASLIFLALFVLLAPLGIELALTKEVRALRKEIQFLNRRIETEQANHNRLQAEYARLTRYSHLSDVIAKKLPHLTHPSPAQLVGIEGEIIDLSIENGLLVMPLNTDPNQ